MSSKTYRTESVQKLFLQITRPSSQTPQTHTTTTKTACWIYLYTPIHHIYRTEGAAAETGRLSGSFSNREMHFSNRLTKEAASTFGFLTAHAIHDPGLMFAEIVY